MALLRDARRLISRSSWMSAALDWPEQPERFDVVYNLLAHAE